MKSFKITDSRTMGIKEWLTPQISEHWPKKTPVRFKTRQDCLIRPGTASILIPNEGTVQEWITSKEEQRIRTGVSEGKIKQLSTSKRRMLERLDGVI